MAFNGDSGNVSIGTTTDTGQKLYVNGNIVATGEVTAYSASDIRLKANIKPIMSAIDVINKLNPVSYNWNEKAKELNPLKDDSTEYGLIAQELEEVLPELVHPIYDGEYKSIDYVKIVPLLIGAIKELQLEINELKINNMTLPNTGITTNLVKNIIGSSTNNVGQLCTHSNVNKWSKWKPVAYNTVSPITTEILSSVRFGLSIPVITGPSLS